MILSTRYILSNLLFTLLSLFFCAETSRDALEQFFNKLVSRSDVGLILISQPSADMIRQSILDHKAMIPMILEIPAASGGEAYDASKDPIMKRVLQMLGES